MSQSCLLFWGNWICPAFFFFFSSSQETLICPSADLVRGWKYPNFCFLAVFYFLTGPHPDEITYLHAGNVRQELKIILFRSVNLWQSPCKEISTTCYFTCSPFPHFATVRPGSSATPLYVKERWILLLFNSFFVSPWSSWFYGRQCLDVESSYLEIWNVCRIVGSFAKRSQVAVLNLTLFPFVGRHCRATRTFLCFLFTPLDKNINVERSCRSNNVVGDCVYIQCVYSLLCTYWMYGYTI